ncbi:hypothetical protein HYZ70_02250 [Candidatus Curtissbacteria bacterium]|nr:hypothetical protein [Candidatus Curtissbacteria bacterium]
MADGKFPPELAPEIVPLDWLSPLPDGEATDNTSCVGRGFCVGTLLLIVGKGSSGGGGIIVGKLLGDFSVEIVGGGGGGVELELGGGRATSGGGGGGTAGAEGALGGVSSAKTFGTTKKTLTHKKLNSTIRAIVFFHFLYIV